MGMVASASSSRSAFGQKLAKSTAPNAEMWLATADLTVFTGLRRGELAGLPWRDVDFDNRQLVVQRNRLNPGLNTSEAKSTASNRTIPLSHRAITDLTRLRRIQEEDRAVLGTGWTDTGFVLILPDGMPANPDSITRRFKRDCERAGVRYMTWHGLRHTYATFSLAAGVPIHDVSRILGHSSIAITSANTRTRCPEQRLRPWKPWPTSSSAMTQNSLIEWSCDFWRDKHRNRRFGLITRRARNR